VIGCYCLTEAQRATVHGRHHHEHGAREEDAELCELQRFVLRHDRAPNCCALSSKGAADEQVARDGTDAMKVAIAMLHARPSPEICLRSAGRGTGRAAGVQSLKSLQLETAT
jgi:hypothetical protein